ncbi:MAG: hypothetical protein ACKOF3_13485, partial [Spartobacteria bacterium]
QQVVGDFSRIDKGISGNLHIAEDSILSPAIEQFPRSDPRVVEIHAGVLFRGDAFESGEHEAHELRLEKMPSGGNE